jgi:hypothetical protein
MKSGHILSVISPVFFLLIIMLAGYQVSYAQKGVAAYMSGSTPYNMTFGQWTIKWWTWLMSIPSNVNPASDTTGINCAQGQNGPVWFLAGSTTGKAERSCTVPADKAIFFPIIDSECSYAEYPKLKTESELRSCAISQNDQATRIDTIVDGVSLQNSQIPRVQSPLFSFKFPPNNIFGATPGDSQSVADGYYVFLKPLPVGKHEVSFKAVIAQFTTTGTQNFSQNLLYHLTVK